MKAVLCFWVPAVLLYCCTAAAQEKLRFHSQNYLGLLEGQKGPAFQVQSINGVQRGTWFGGVGAGLDYYYYRSIPLFLSVNKYFKAGDGFFFLSADGGVNIVWDESMQEAANPWLTSHFTPAPYFSGGLGYMIGLRGRHALLMNVGYSVKHINEEVRDGMFCVGSTCPVMSYHNRYTLNRLSMRLGWRF